MAKAAQNNELNNVYDKDKSGLLSWLVGTGLLLFIVLTLILLIKFDVGGFGSNMLRPLLGDVKAVSWMLPKEKKVNYVDPNYPYANVEEAVIRIKELEIELGKSKSETQDVSKQITDLENEIIRLRGFEDTYSKYLAEKELFDEQVVFNPNAPSISEYKTFYEQISAANAEKIYRQVVEQLAVEEETQKVAKAYNEMKPKEAARILEELSSNTALVVDILRSINTEQRAAILGAMDPVIAAKITRAMAK